MSRSRVDCFVSSWIVGPIVGLHTAGPFKLVCYFHDDGAFSKRLENTYPCSLMSDVLL